MLILSYLDMISVETQVAERFRHVWEAPVSIHTY
jgi:hypothetical protein